MTGIGENTLAQPVKPPLRERCACLAKLVKNRLTLTGSSSISLGPPMPRNLDLSPSGAVVSSDLAVLIAEVRAFTAPC